MEERFGFDASFMTTVRRDFSKYRVHFFQRDSLCLGIEKENYNQAADAEE